MEIPSHATVTARLCLVALLSSPLWAVTGLAPGLAPGLAIGDTVDSDVTDKPGAFSVAGLHRCLGLDGAQALSDDAAPPPSATDSDPFHELAALLEAAAELQRSNANNNVEGLLVRAVHLVQAAPGIQADLRLGAVLRLGALYAFQHRFDEAEALYERHFTEDLFAAVKPHHVTNALAARYTARVQRGDLAGARALEPRYLRHVRATSAAPASAEAGALLTMAGMLTDHPALSLTYLQRAHRLAARLPASERTHWLRTVNFQMASLHQRMGEHERALKLFRKVLQSDQQVHGPDSLMVFATLQSLVLSEQSTGAWAQSQRTLERMLTIAQNQPQLFLQMLVLGQLARVHARRGELAAAVELAVRTERMVLAQMAAAPSSESAQLGRAFGLDFAFLAVYLAMRHKDPAIARIAGNAVLYRKGYELTADMGSAHLLRSAHSDDIRRLARDIRSLNSCYATFLTRGRELFPPARYQQYLERLRSRRKLLKQAGDNLYRQSAGTQAIDIGAVQTRLPAGSVFIDWVTYPTEVQIAPTDHDPPMNYAAMVLRPSGRPTWIDLGPVAAIDALVRNYRSQVQRRLGSADEVARALDKLVLAPVVDGIKDIKGADHLILAPDSQLLLVPFGALVDGQGRYRIESWNISYVTSANELVAIRERPDRAPQQPPLVLGAPDFGPTDGPSARFTPLSGTADEARSVASHLPGARVLTGAQATEHAARNARGPGILHLATHSFHDPACAPSTDAVASVPLLRSGLALTGANVCKSGADDGLLTAFEASALDLDGTELVVLSACETGVGETVPHRAIQGLRSAIFQAGAEAQLVSLWRVDDVATRALMTGYYAALARKLGRAQALREVQQLLLADERSRHPYYWASFIPVGDWTEIAHTHIAEQPLTGTGTNGTGTAGIGTTGRTGAIRTNTRGCHCRIGVAPSSHGPGRGLFLALLAALACCARRRASNCKSEPAATAPTARSSTRSCQKHYPNK